MARGKRMNHNESVRTFCRQGRERSIFLRKSFMDGHRPILKSMIEDDGGTTRPEACKGAEKLQRTSSLATLGGLN